jgi:hypothetical protein
MIQLQYFYPNKQWINQIRERTYKYDTVKVENQRGIGTKNCQLAIISGINGFQSTSAHTIKSLETTVIACIIAINYNTHFLMILTAFLSVYFVLNVTAFALISTGNRVTDETTAKNYLQLRVNKLF